MKVRKILGLLLAAAMTMALLAGCGGSSNYKSESFHSEEAAMDGYYDYDGLAAAPGSGSSGSALQLPEGRKWIVTINMQAETEDLDSLLASVNEKINALGGYVENQDIYNGSGYSRSYRNASMTVRIPVARAGEFTDEVKALSNVTSTSQTAQDVTLNYVDTESRIAALKTEEERLLALMEQAENMEDLLTIEERLTDVRYQLEGYGSRLRVLDNQIDYATIYLNMEEVQKFTPVEEPTFWERISEGFLDSVASLWENLLNFVLLVVVALPHLIVIGLFVGIIVAICLRASRRNRKRREQAQAQAQAQWAAQRRNMAQPPIPPQPPVQPQNPENKQ